MKRTLHELNFFKVIENAEEKTQKKISSEISTSIGFANALIKKFLKKGIIKVKQAPYKRFIYYLTPDGFANKIRLVKEYIDESLNFFRKIRKEFNEVIVKDSASGFYLYGTGEICEIARGTMSPETNVTFECFIPSFRRAGKLLRFRYRDNLLLQFEVNRPFAEMRISCNEGYNPPCQSILLKQLSVDRNDLKCGI